jgi:hypothetical protein
MNLKNYTGYFHDGSINAIDHSGNSMILSMESAEMFEEDIVDDVILSKVNGMNLICIKLHIEGIKSIKENDEPYSGSLELKSDYAEIFHLNISENKVELQIIWGFYSNPEKEDFSSLEIEAEKIWWENPLK